MNATKTFLTLGGCFVAMVVLAQAPAPAPQAPAAPQQGPGVQAPNDARYADFVAMKCKNPPQRGGRGGGGGGAGAGGRGGGAPGGAAGAAGGPGGAPGGGGGRGGGRGAAGPPAHRDYMVTAIPGVIAAGQKWTSIWTGTGNNADGIIADKDGGILAAQNTNSDVMLIDKNNKVSFPIKDTNTGGAISRNKKGALFIVERGLPASIWQLEPKRQKLTDTFNGEPLDCIGGVINDLTADSKGGVYFTMGPFGASGLYYADPKGVVTKQGSVVNTNGLILSPDEKTIYVTGRVGGAAAPAAGGRGGAPAAPAAAGQRADAAPGPAPDAPAAAPDAARGGRGGAGGGGGMVAYDIKPDGSVTNERQFAMVGGDGAAVDSMGRVYVTGGNGVQVIARDGKFLGEIPSPLGLISVGFSGKDKKTLYGVANTQQYDEIFTIPMIAQGYKGRAK